MDRVDVVVLGGGLAGAAVAWHLSQDRTVAVIERGQRPGGQASAQNAGMVRLLGEDPYERALAIRTAAWLADADPDYFEGASRVTGGVLALGTDPHWLSDGVAHLRASGIAVEELRDPSAVAPALVGAPLLRSWYLPTARVADAHALVEGFLRGARHHGAWVWTGAEVQAVAVEGGKVVGVDVDGSRVHCDAVVLAAGAWSGAIAATLGLTRPLFPIRRTLLQTAAHPLSAPDHPWCWVDDVGIYARPEGAGWLVSGCDETLDPPESAESRGPVEALPRALAATKLEQWFPRLADARFTGGWTGLRTFAPDRRPILGADPDLDGLWWAAGLGGFGVSTCYGVGEALGAWMRGEQLSWIRPRGVSAGRDFPRRWSIRPTGDLAGAHLIPGAGGQGPS